MRSETIHATAVAHAGKAAVLLGPSGAGKSSLALRMIALGAKLISDDRTLISVRDGLPFAACPQPHLRGVIEARGIGLLHCDTIEVAPVVLAVDLSRDEMARLPEKRRISLAGCEVDLVLRPQNIHLAEALMLWLSHGRMDPVSTQRTE